MSTESIKDIVGQYATPDYDGVQIEEDKDWELIDLISLLQAIEAELRIRTSPYLMQERRKK